jgi:2-phosphoglycerate kinase
MVWKTSATDSRRMGSRAHRPWDVFVLGGSSGTGKTSVSYRLARHYGVGITEADDLFIAAQAVTTPRSLPAIHAWWSHPDPVSLAPAEILEMHLAASRAMSPAIRAVIQNHLDDGPPIVLEGDYILPEALELGGDESPSARVRGVWLYEPDVEQLERNFLAREGEAENPGKRAAVSSLYGSWLRQDCQRRGLPAIPARPWGTVLQRLKSASA